MILAIAVLLPICGYGQRVADTVKPTPWYESIAVHAFLSSAYSYNFNKPDSMKNQFRVFDFDDNSLKIDVIELSLSKAVAGRGEAGFRCDMTAGSSIPQVAHSSGLDMGDIDFHQIFLSYVAPVGNGLRLDFGKFITSMGYEVIEGYDGYNDNYSHSFLFGYAIPYTHTGMKAAYSFSDHLSAILMIVNGWDNAVDNNKSKSIFGQVSIQPLSGMSVSANYLSGPEKDFNNSDNRQLVDLVASYAVDPTVTVGLNGDYGTEENSTGTGGDATWLGIAAYLRLHLTDDFSLSVRGEHFEDKAGLRTGVEQKLQEVTITAEFKPADYFIVRGDARLDLSDRDVFQRKNNFTDTQFTMSLNVLFVF